MTANPFDPALWTDAEDGDWQPADAHITPAGRMTYGDRVRRAYATLAERHGFDPDTPAEDVFEELAPKLERPTRKAPAKRKRATGKQTGRRKPPDEEIPEGMKWCNCCKAPQPLEAFGKDKNSKDGLNPRCRECNRHRARKEPHPTKEGSVNE